LHENTNIEIDYYYVHEGY